MPFSPECFAEFRQGFTRCSSCDVELVDSLPESLELSDEAVREALSGQELIPLVRGQFEVLKEIRVYLAEAHIVSLIVDDPDDVPQPGVPKRVMLVVGNADEQEARQVLGQRYHEMIEQEGLIPSGDLSYDKCPACGHPVSEDMEECPECGLAIGRA